MCSDRCLQQLCKLENFLARMQRTGADDNQRILRGLNHVGGTGNRFGVGTEAFHANIAAHAKGAADGAHADCVGHG